MPTLNIPDTVIFKYASINAWYFTNKAGKVKRKTKERLNISAIQKKFLRRTKRNSKSSGYSTNK